jgi:arylsulfatase A-like enzyme
VPPQQKSTLFLYLTLLTGLFILLEISLFIQSSQLYLGDYRLIADQLKIPFAILPGAVYFFSVQLLLHLAFIIFIWGLANLCGNALNLSILQIEKLGIGLWIIGLFTILLANHYLYPNSKFSTVINYIFFIYPGFANVLLIICLSILFCAIIVALYQIRVISIIFIIGLISLYAFPHMKQPTDAATTSKPNIILIGVDSLRPDFLGFFGGQKITPHIDHFLQKAAVFSESLTPLARTYPAWVSILTGKYPKENGVRFNLAEKVHFNLDKTLPAILRDHGYKTIYATDETRFSNIDQKLGFDEIVTPPVGFNDFFIGSLNDFPLSNLLVNTFIGKYLLPYSYGNRAAFITYEPNTFLTLLKPTLEKSRTKPLFLAVHFCLPHFPYVWAEQPFKKIMLHNYQASVHRADKQVYDLLKMLKKNNLLQHSVVVLLSDHGEAIELSGDRITNPELYVPQHHPIPHFYPSSTDFEKVNQSAGHGTDVLGLTQYHNVLAFRFFGTGGQKNTVISGLASLLDIKPTLLKILKISDADESGKSLVDAISGKQSHLFSNNDFFIESDFSPEAVRSVHPETRKVLFEGIYYFQIDPITTRLTVKKSMVDLILSSKQYADYYGEWVLALYPQNHLPMKPILVNLKTGQWTDDLHNSLANQAPIAHMLKSLKKFYGNDIQR